MQQSDRSSLWRWKGKLEIKRILYFEKTKQNMETDEFKSVNLLMNGGLYKERYDKKLSKAYLEGRYGAIPVFRQFSFRKGE